MLNEMYDPAAGSPASGLGDDIDSTQTSIPVDDASVFPEAPNLVTILTEDAFETIIYEGRDTTNNLLTSCDRGAQGVAQGWDEGTLVVRSLTALDQQIIQDNLGILETAFTNHEGAGGAVHATATAEAHGFLSSNDKGKLDGIDDNANNYSLESHDNTYHDPDFLSEDDYEGVHHYIAKELDGKTGNNPDQVWLLCPFDGGDNEVIGRIYGQRSSGNWDAFSADIIISTRASNNTEPASRGTLKNMVVRSGRNLTLNTCTYDGKDYWCIRWFGGGYMLDQVYFSGYLRGDDNAFLNLETDQVSNLSGAIVSDDIVSNFYHDIHAHGDLDVDGDLNVTGDVSGNNINASNWDDAYTERGSQIAGTGLSWSAGDLVIDNPFDPTGTYANLRAQATTAGDVGITDLGSAEIITSTERTNLGNAHSHISADGSSHTYINQDLRTSASPEFNRLTVNNDSFDHIRLVRGSETLNLNQGVNDNLYITWENAPSYGTGSQWQIHPDGTIEHASGEIEVDDDLKVDGGADVGGNVLARNGVDVRGSTHHSYNGVRSTTANNGHLMLDSNTGNLYLNWEDDGGVYVGNGGNVIVELVDGSGRVGIDVNRSPSSSYVLDVGDDARFRDDVDVEGTLRVDEVLRIPVGEDMYE